MQLINLLTSGLLATSAWAAQLTQVTYPNTGATNVGMYVYKPDKLAANLSIVVVIHSCQSSAQAYFQNAKIPWKQGSDAGGYITIWPSSPNSGTCWDVSSKKSLTHNGGGDSNAIANMIKYATTQYSVDPKRVFVTGGSSGGEFARGSGCSQVYDRSRTG